MSIFSTFLELHFSGLKSFLFYRENQQMFLSGFFFLKKLYKEKVDFFDKKNGLTPLQNVDFLDFWRTLLFRSKNHCFFPEYQKLFVSGFSCLKKSYKKKVDFFDENQDWPLCKKAIFLTLLELHFSGLKSILYFPEYQKLFVSDFFFTQKKT